MSKLEHRNLPLDMIEVRDSAAGPTIRGHAAVFESFSDPIAGMFVERIQRGAFARAIKEKQDVRALLNHDPNIILGRTKSGTLRLAEDRAGLMVEIDPPDTAAARDVMISIRRGDIDQMSFAFRAVTELWSAGGGPNDEEVRDLIDVDLFDVSPVAFPAYPETDVAVRSCEMWRRERVHDAAILRLRLALARAGA